MDCIIELDPFAETGRWALLTRSGSQYEIRNDSFDEPVRVRRLADVSKDSSVSLRRDGDWLRLANVACGQGGILMLASGVIRVGCEAILEMEPLAPDAVVTVRWTTTVACIAKLDSLA